MKPAPLFLRILATILYGAAAICLTCIYFAYKLPDWTVFPVAFGACACVLFFWDTWWEK